jgi:hypothetical protein
MRCSRRKRKGAAMESGSHWRQPFAADTAAIAQNGAPTLRRVPAQEAVLTFAANFRWLILAFHKSLPLRGVRSARAVPEKRATLSAKEGVSTPRVKSKIQIPISKIKLQMTVHGCFGICFLKLVWNFHQSQLHTCKHDFLV